MAFIDIEDHTFCITPVRNIMGINGIRKRSNSCEILRSSANRRVLCSACISLIRMLNSKEPKWDPWGTADLTEITLGTKLFTLTTCVLWKPWNFDLHSTSYYYNCNKIFEWNIIDRYRHTYVTLVTKFSSWTISKYFKREYFWIILTLRLDKTYM